ncbi:serine/threonine protein kinase [bacterium]|nr:serine/threonine protein kinase [bacterium]
MPGTTTNQSHQTCPQCQALLPSDVAFCPACGTATATSVPDQAGLPTFGGMPTVDPSTPSLPPPGSEIEILVSGARLGDRYVIQEKIGIGGMGVVYKASDEVTDETVAIKLLHPNRQAGQGASKRLKQEGITARNIRQKNVVSIYDIGESNGQPFISMEYLEGMSLRRWQRQWQQKGESIPAHLIFQVIHQILLGLQAAHEAGVVHRDLKPENVMVVSEDENEIFVKILDFGIARIAQVEPSSTGALGTRGYMAPEQLTNPDFAKPSADLYSVSAMFYELLADVIPHGHWQPPSAGRTDIPQGIDQLIEKGLSNRPGNRIQTSHQYMDELKRLAGHLHVETVDAQLAGQNQPHHLRKTSSPSDQTKIVVAILCIVGFFAVMLFFGMLAAIFDSVPDPNYNQNQTIQQPRDWQNQNQIPPEFFMN